LFSDDARVKEVKWLGKGDQLVWLKEVDFGATELWIANGDAEGRGAINLSQPSTIESESREISRRYCAGRIRAKATHLKVHRLRNEHDDIAIAVACPATTNGNLYNAEDADLAATIEVRNAVWYATLRKKEMTSGANDVKYIVSPANFVNAVRGTGLECSLNSAVGSSSGFDISSSGIVFLAKDVSAACKSPQSIDAYYIPLKSFTEVAEPKSQIVQVRGLEGRSFNPVFSPNGDSIAFLKKGHPINLDDRNRVIVINNMRDFRAHMAIDKAPTQESEKHWHLSRYTIAWSENGKELYVVAVEAGIRRLFKIPATLSSIRAAPEPITSASVVPADVRYLRMVFSAPMDPTLVHRPKS